MLFILALKTWQVLVLTKKHVVSLGIDKLASSCFDKKSVDALGILGLTCGWFRKKPVDSLDVEGWHMLFILALRTWQVLVLT